MHSCEYGWHGGGGGGIEFGFFTVNVILQSSLQPSDGMSTSNCEK